VRTGGGASIASITKLVDVEASLSLQCDAMPCNPVSAPQEQHHRRRKPDVGVVSSDFARDFDGRVLVCLLELDNSRNLHMSALRPQPAFQRCDGLAWLLPPWSHLGERRLRKPWLMNSILLLDVCEIFFKLFLLLLLF
jgi:hypothetical protein